MRTEADWIINAERALPLDPKLTPAIIRAIQLDALREARKIAERVGDDDLGHAALRHDLNKLIRELELK